MSFAPCVVIEQLVGDFMTNRQSVDVSICAAVHVVAKCRPLKLDAAARPTNGNRCCHRVDLPLGGQSMKRKPDLLWILVILFGLGVVTTGYAQSLWASKADAPVELAQLQQQSTAFKR
jgi:hypothetical protein